MAETAARLLRAAKQRLQSAGSPSAALDARLLLQAATQQSHAELVADPEMPIPEAQQDAYEAMLARREKREPVSRILGEREFHGRRFVISPAVLDPRPDSEALIDAALELARGRKVGRLIDLGTGSGILALTLLAEWAECTALATDVSAEALAIAARNAALLGVEKRVTFRQSDWWEDVNEGFDLIVSNPPYIPESEIDRLEPDVKDHDPRGALSGGDDGLSCYRRIAEGAAARLQTSGFVLVEIGAGQAEDVTQIFNANDFNVLGEWRDLGGRTRVLGFHCR